MGTGSLGGLDSLRAGWPYPPYALNTALAKDMMYAHNHKDKAKDMMHAHDQTSNEKSTPVGGGGSDSAIDHVDITELSDGQLDLVRGGQMYPVSLKSYCKLLLETNF